MQLLGALCDVSAVGALRRVRGELPYACKGGVCSTCRARVVSGSVTMARNYALELRDQAHKALAASGLADAARLALLADKVVERNF